MFRNVEWHIARAGRGAKVVVWTASVHAARRGVGERTPLGMRIAERWGALYAAIGFTALGGQSSRAGGLATPLSPAPADALEARAPGAMSAAWYLDARALR